MKNDSLDNKWKDKIYERAGNMCEYCERPDTLNAHHIFSRSNYAVRWDIDNGVCLCVAHHVFSNKSFHKAPIEMLEWLKEKRGEEWWNRLRAKANRIKKKSEWRDIYEKELKNT